MEKSSQIAWKIVTLRRFFPLKVVPLIEVLLYKDVLQSIDSKSSGNEVFYNPDPSSSKSLGPLKIGSNFRWRYCQTV
jgi:hypothetical protein